MVYYHRGFEDVLKVVIEWAVVSRCFASSIHDTVTFRNQREQRWDVLREMSVFHAIRNTSKFAYLLYCLTLQCHHSMRVRWYEPNFLSWRTISVENQDRILGYD